jgi:hypothetical protein
MKIVRCRQCHKIVGCNSNFYSAKCKTCSHEGTCRMEFNSINTEEYKICLTCMTVNMKIALGKFKTIIAY